MSQSPITREELTALLSPIREDVKEILAHLKEQNSKIATNSTDIAILKDRQPSRTAMAYGSAAGAFVGAIGILIDYLLFRRP